MTTTTFQPIPAAGTRIMQLDSMISAGFGLALIAFNELLATATGIPTTALVSLGVVALAWAAAMSWSVREPQRLYTMLRVGLAGNIVWVLASFAVLLAGAWTLTPLGVALVIANALAVEAIAFGQWRAIR